MNKKYKVILCQNDKTSERIIIGKNNCIKSVCELINNAVSSKFYCSQNLLNQTKSFVDKQKLLYFLERENFNLTEKNCIFLQPDDLSDCRFTKIYVVTV